MRNYVKNNKNTRGKLRGNRRRKNFFAKISAVSVFIFAISFFAWLNFAGKNQNLANAATSDIFSIGSAEITSITDDTGAKIFNENGATTAEIASGGSQKLIFNYEAQIADAGALNTGDTVQIKMGVDPDSHYYGTPALSFDAEIQFGGKTIFTVKYSAAVGVGTITLTATDEIANVSGELKFNLQGTGTVWLANDFTTLWTTYTLGGKNYKINNAAVPFTARDGNATGVVMSPTPDGSTLSLATTFSRTYNQLLDGTLDLTDPLLKEDLIFVMKIPANNVISNVAWDDGGRSRQFMAWVTPDGSSMTGQNIGSWTSSAENSFSAGEIPQNATMAQIEVALKPGERAIQRNPDNSWTVAINWGALLNNDLTKWVDAANVSSVDSATDKLLQLAKKVELSAYQIRQQIRVFFADSSVKSRVDGITTETNLTNLITRNDGQYATNTPVNNAAAGQTAVKISHLDIYGNPVAAVENQNGWPTGNSAGETATAPVSAAPKTLANFALITNSAILQNLAQTLQINSADILTTSAQIAFPTSGATEKYYLYAPIYTVNFDNNCETSAQNSAANSTLNSAENSENSCPQNPPAQKITQDSGEKTAQKPANPTREHYAFLGWFSDKNLTKKFDFTSVISANLTLYASWKIDSFEVNFVDENGNLISRENVDFGDAATAPNPDEIPANSGEKFVGWDKKFDFITGNLTVQAIYEKICPWNAEILLSDENCKNPDSESENENAENNLQNSANSSKNSAQVLAPNTGIFAKINYIKTEIKTKINFAGKIRKIRQILREILRFSIKFSGRF